ncbi:protein kinase [Trypanosoma conorhini]|uniref:Protein kinase n=1 Tax=Trypanosoma conorhini TaxID=83891 RepID=A0A3R7RI62_9TRYP|nr:protein kinase [Trypanosoma conorhini]RNF03076.1 protein kinase [Trypanosoma conorhini]
MDYTLSDMMHGRHSRGHLTEAQTKAIAFLTLHALVDLHDRIGMVHADLSPSNIFLRATGELKLGDLSSAIPVDAAVDYFSGTFLYAAVEVLKDRQLASNPSSDIWALGVTLHECVSGRHPFAEASCGNFWEFLSLLETAMRAGRQPVRLPRISQGFYHVLSAMLRWDPAQRPSARSLLKHMWFSQYNVTSAQRELCIVSP